MALTRNSENLKSTKKHCCLFCYKAIIDKDEQSYHPVPQNDKMNIFNTFYRHICSIGTPEPPTSSDSSAPAILTTTGICDDCFYGIDMYCKITQEIKALRLKLNWHLDQFHKIMKSASRIPTRVKNFNESFHHQHEDNNGDLVVTIKQGRKQQAMECRQKILNACTSSLEKEISQKPDVNAALESRESITGQLEDKVNLNEDNSLSTSANENNDENACEDLQNSDSDLEVVEVIGPTVSATSVKSGTPNPVLVPMTKPSGKEKESGQAVYQCSRGNCHKFFLNRESLNRHLKQHGQFICKFCNFETSQAKTLVEHEVHLHSSKATDRKFICPRCPKILGATRQSQKMHYYRKHIGFDGQGFSKPKLTDKLLNKNGAVKLKSSENQSHSNDLFSCSACECNFKIKDLLIRHFKTAHPNRTCVVRKSRENSM